MRAAEVVAALREVPEDTNFPGGLVLAVRCAGCGAVGIATEADCHGRPYVPGWWKQAGTPEVQACSGACADGACADEDAEE